MLDEFYGNLRVSNLIPDVLAIDGEAEWRLHSLGYSWEQAVGVSAMTGAGMKEFFQAVDEAREEYEA